MTRLFDSPNPDHAVARYRRHAAGYDDSARRTAWIRVRTIEKLALRPGDRVLDVACGTGLSLGRLRDAVGGTGQVFGIDVSPDMIQMARQRIAEAGWGNVGVIESPVESAEIPSPLDAILFHFSHDVLRSPAAVQRIFAAARPGARVAFAGMKFAPWWLAPVNLVVRVKARPYVTTFEGLHAPWDLALPYLESFDRRSVMLGAGYIGWGRLRRAGRGG